jgi:hypothetical protein
MVFAHQIRGVIADYLSKSIDANKFLEQFSALSYNIHGNGEAEAIRLADSVESYLVDLRAGCIGELEFRSILRDLSHINDVNVFHVPMSFPVSVNHVSVVEMAYQGTSASSGTSRGMAFGSELHLQG